jgi:hypothetical protein
MRPRFGWAGSERSWRPVRAIAGLVITAAGFAIYANLLDRVYPVGEWLLPAVLKIWGFALLLCAGALCFGQLLLTRVLRMHDLPALESAVFALCLGVFTQAALLFAAGAFGLLEPAVAVAITLGMSIAGLRDGLRLAARASGPRTPRRSSAWASLATIGGGAALGLLYLQSFTPDALNYDAGWMHVKIAEDYARHGRIIAFPGNYHGGLPHLASLLYTWAYLVPGLELAERWMLVLHLEFSIVVWTLFGVAAAVQRMLGDFELRGSWAAFFLFPGILVYDSNLGGSADHVLAFFSIAILLATFRVLRSFAGGAWVLLGVASAGALLTKYQAFYVLLPVGILVAARWLRSVVPIALGEPCNPAHQRQLLRAPAWLLGTGAALLAPQFLKNWIFYHNPLYPLMQRVFVHSSPSVKDGWLLVDQIYTDAAWIPTGTLRDKLAHAAELFFTFSFQPHYTFNGNVPAFGSLFTLLLPAIALAASRRRIAVAALIGSTAILLWGYTYNVDRNLQTFMPILAGVVGALVVELWRLGGVARVGLIPLIALQIGWGADAGFYSSKERLQSSINLISSTFDGRAATRFKHFRDSYVSIGKALPKRAKLLLHTTHVSLGIDRDVILDWAGFQGLISYAEIRTPRELFDRYRALGITHMLDEPNRRAAPSKQEDVLFQTFVKRHGRRSQLYGGYRLTTMPDHPPPAEKPYRVLSLGVSSYADGLYPIESLDAIESLPPHMRRFKGPAVPLTADNAQALSAQADAVICGSGSCAEHRVDQRSLQSVVSYPGSFSIFVPKR